MLEKAPGIARTHRIEGTTHRFQQGFSGARLGSSQEPFDLRGGFFDRIEVWGGRWQVEKLATSSVDELPDPTALVGGEVVHHHFLSRRKGGSQDSLHVGLEDSLRGRSLHRERRPHPLKSHARE